jgi:FKBP-type peptidyl-prolyl cis-trans isomerase
MTLSTVVLALQVGCGGGGSQATPAPAPRPSLDDVTRTTFAPELGVDIATMSRRPSGLYVQELRAGTGAVAYRDRTAVVRYIGWLANGKEFDRGEVPVKLGAGEVIRAWEEGVLGMRVGGVRRLVTPPNLAYGSRGSGNTIPADAVLVFEMQLVDVR